MERLLTAHLQWPHGLREVGVGVAKIDKMKGMKETAERNCTVINLRSAAARSGKEASKKDPRRTPPMLSSPANLALSFQCLNPTVLPPTTLARRRVTSQTYTVQRYHSDLDSNHSNSPNPTSLPGHDQDSRAPDSCKDPRLIRKKPSSTPFCLSLLFFMVPQSPAVHCLRWITAHIFCSSHAGPSGERALK